MSNLPPNSNETIAELDVRSLDPVIAPQTYTDLPSADSVPPPPRSKDPMIGRTIANLYIEEKIGRGGFGAVYLAEHTTLHTAYAVKVLNLTFQDHEEAVERFRREARSVASLDHPNVVRVKDFGFFEDEGFYYLIMEYLDGRTLQQSIKNREPFSLDWIHNFTRQLCSAIGYVHGKGIVHRDLKPANIFLVPDRHGNEIVKLLDFGVATVIDGSQITQSGSCIGSPTYMSPEQAEGNTHYVDGRADLYSLAVIFFELLTGLPPFVGDSFASLLRQHLLSDPPTLAKTAPHNNWAPALEKFFVKAFEKYPEDRHKDAATFWKKFDRALRDQAELSAEFRPAAPFVASLSPQQASLKDSPSEFNSRHLSNEPIKDAPTRRDKRAQRHQRPALRLLMTISLITLVCGMLAMGIVRWLQSTTSPNPTAAKRTAPVRLIIRSQPSGAEVWINAERLGKTPCVLRSKAGQTFTLTLKREGYFPKTLQQTLQSGSLQEKLYTLESISSLQPRSTARAQPDRPRPPPLRFSFTVRRRSVRKRRRKKRRKRRRPPILKKATPTNTTPKKESKKPFDGVGVPLGPL